MELKLFNLIGETESLKKLLGNDLRIHPFGQNLSVKREYPYVVYQHISGHESVYFDDRSDADFVSIQFDVYASSNQTADTARECAEALRQAIELHCYITSWRGVEIDPETKSYRISFDCDFILER